MQSETRSYRTGGHDVVLDLTPDCAEFVRRRGDGLLHVFVPHATAGLAVLETGAGSDDDLLAALD
ncbi:MAG: YjbQ family protein, partial [Nocardioidaceae bacterium]